LRNTQNKSLSSKKQFSFIAKTHKHEIPHFSAPSSFSQFNLSYLQNKTSKNMSRIPSQYIVPVDTKVAFPKGYWVLGQTIPTQVTTQTHPHKLPEQKVVSVGVEYASGTPQGISSCFLAIQQNVFPAAGVKSALESCGRMYGKEKPPTEWQLTGQLNKEAPGLRFKTLKYVGKTRDNSPFVICAHAPINDRNIHKYDNYIDFVVKNCLSKLTQEQVQKIIRKLESKIPYHRKLSNSVRSFPLDELYLLLINIPPARK